MSLYQKKNNKNEEACYCHHCHLDLVQKKVICNWNTGGIPSELSSMCCITCVKSLKDNIPSTANRYTACQCLEEAASYHARPE